MSGSPTIICAAGRSSYYIYNIRKACTCCGDPKAENRDDYDADLEHNRNTSLKCVKGNDGNIAFQLSRYAAVSEDGGINIGS